MNALSLLTFNIECSQYQTRHEKINQLLEFMKYKSFDCLCLQDVNLTSLSILKSKLNNYNVIEALNNQKSKTSQIIMLSNSITILEEYSYDIPSLENKEILGCKILWNEKEVEIINVHLEDESSSYRGKQVDIIYEITAENNNYVIVGDFNIVSMEEEASVMLLKNKKFTDSWINDGCVSCLRNTTFVESNKMDKVDKVDKLDKLDKLDKWARTTRLLYVKSCLDCKCTGLINFNSNKSMVTFSVL